VITDSIQVIDSDTVEIDRQISDHDGTYVTFKCGFSNQKTYQRTIWDYKRGDYTLMKQQIIDTNWEKLINDELELPVCLSKCVGLSIILKRPLTTTISFIVVGRFTIKFLFKSPRQIIWLFSSSACFNIKSKNCQ
jgi:hypothetical protein